MFMFIFMSNLFPCVVWRPCLCFVTFALSPGHTKDHNAHHSHSRWSIFPNTLLHNFHPTYTRVGPSGMRFSHQVFTTFTHRKEKPDAPENPRRWSISMKISDFFGTVYGCEIFHLFAAIWIFPRRAPMQMGWYDHFEHTLHTQIFVFLFLTHRQIFSNQIALPNYGKHITWERSNKTRFPCMS